MQRSRPRPPVAPLHSDEQAAATAPIGPVFILAGGGSGKTHTIAARIAIWLKSGVAPFLIVCLTNSTGGRDDITERVGKFLADDAETPVHGFFVRSPQQFALDLLRAGGMQALGRSGDFTIWDTHDANDCVSNLLGGNAGNPGQVHGTAMRLLQQRKMNLKALPNEPSAAVGREEAAVLEAYQAVKIRHNVVDGDDLVPLALQALQQNPEFLASAQRSTGRYLLVDDLQDIRPREFLMVRLLAGPERSVTVAANPNQCVRRDGGAYDKLMEIPGLDTLGLGGAIRPLTLNLRSTRAVGDAVKLLTQDPAMKDLKEERQSYSPRGFRVGRDRVPMTPPKVLEFEGRPADMCRHILERTQRLMDQGYAPADIACIYHDASLLDRLRTVAISRGLPYTVLGGQPRERNRAVRCITGLLSSALNPYDISAFLNVMSFNPHLDPQRLDSDMALRIARMSTDEHLTLCQAAARCLQNPWIDGDVRLGLEFVVNAVGILDRALADAATHIDDLCWQAVALLENAVGPAHRVRELAQVQKLLALAGLNSRRFVPGLNEHNPLRELRDFLDVIHPGLRPDPLAAEQNDPFAAGRGIVFSTVTAARGLQWPVVWAVGASDYILPGEIPASDWRRKRQAQRLFYVWSTRARDQLFYCHAVRSGPTQGARPSRFLDAIPHIVDHEVVPAPKPRR